jgi:hypothetical protein
VEATITLEFISDTKHYLKALEHQLKHIHGVKVNLVEPHDHTIPALVGIGIDEKAEHAVQNVAQTLYSFLREEQSVQGQKKIFLVTKEGDRVEIEKLSVDEIKEIIVVAQEG